MPENISILSSKAKTPGAVFTVAAKKAAFFKASLFSRSSSVFTVAAKKAAFLRAI
jgi:hypothetical protein